MAEWIAEYKYKRFNEMTEVINDIYRFTCSACGWSTGQQGISFQFCPHCGAPMKNANNPKIVPISVLEDIKAEIDNINSIFETEYDDENHYISGAVEYIPLSQVMDIIDKHINKEGGE